MTSDHTPDAFSITVEDTGQDLFAESVAQAEIRARFLAKKFTGRVVQVTNIRTREVVSRTYRRRKEAPRGE